MARLYGNKKLSDVTDFGESIVVAAVARAAIDGEFYGLEMVQKLGQHLLVGGGHHCGVVAEGAAAERTEYQHLCPVRGGNGEDFAGAFQMQFQKFFRADMHRIAVMPIVSVGRGVPQIGGGAGDYIHAERGREWMVVVVFQHHHALGVDEVVVVERVRRGTVRAVEFLARRLGFQARVEG